MSSPKPFPPWSRWVETRGGWEDGKIKAHGERSPRSRFLSPALPLPFFFLSLVFTYRSLCGGERCPPVFGPSYLSTGLSQVQFLFQNPPRSLVDEAKRPQEIWVRDVPVQTSLDVLDSKRGKSLRQRLLRKLVRIHCEQTPLFAVCKTNKLRAGFIFIEV